MALKAATMGMGIKMWQSGQGIKLIKPLCEKCEPKRSDAIFFAIYFMK